MAHKTFVLTVTHTAGEHVAFNITYPDGSTKSGDRETIEKCIAELKTSVRYWNSSRHDMFPIAPPEY